MVKKFILICIFFLLAFKLPIYGLRRPHYKPCYIPPTCCYPWHNCAPYCNPYGTPPEEACCEPAPMRGLNCGLTVCAMTAAVVLIAGVAAIILWSDGEHAHSH